MRVLYTITLATATLTYFGLCWLKPIQQDILKREQQQHLKSQYEQAKQACLDSVGAYGNASMDVSGVIYCISAAGKLVATISGNQP